MAARCVEIYWGAMKAVPTVVPSEEEKARLLEQPGKLDCSKGSVALTRQRALGS